MKLFFKISVIVWFLAILILSIMPGQDLPSCLLFGFIPIDKFGHFSFYASLCFLLLKNSQYSTKGIGTKSKILSFAIAVVYGALMEVIQGTFCPSRCADIHDVVANSIGAIIGLLAFLFLPNMIEKLFSIIFRKTNSN